MEPLIVWNNPFGVDVPRTEKPGGSFAQAETVQQTFVLMKTPSRRLEDVFRLRLQKTSWSRRTYWPYSKVFRRRLQDVLIKTNIFVLVIHLQDVFKAFWRHLQDVYEMFWKRLQDVFKTSSRRLAKMSSRRFQDVSSSYAVLVNIFSRCLQVGTSGQN